MSHDWRNWENNTKSPHTRESIIEQFELELMPVSGYTLLTERQKSRRGVRHSYLDDFMTEVGIRPQEEFPKP